MRLAITVTAQRRPVHLARCLRSVDTAMVKAWGEARPDVFVAIDESPHPGETEAVEAEARARVECHSKQVRVNRPAWGLWARENVQWHVYEWAFGEGAEAILAIEDDCVLSPDALYLAEWFLADHANTEWLFLNLAQPSIAGDIEGRENDVIEVTRITSPWAWVFTREAWTAIRPRWNIRETPPRGWDWSLSWLMAQERAKALAPVLARARNIGRDLGANGGAAIYDETLARMPSSDGSWSDDDSYRLVRNEGGGLVWGREPWLEDACR